MNTRPIHMPHYRINVYLLGIFGSIIVHFSPQSVAVILRFVFSSLGGIMRFWLSRVP